MRVFALVVVHDPEMPTSGNLKSGDSLHWVNLYESWSISQFSTCMTLLIHGCQRNSFWNCQTDSQMYTFPDQMNWQFVQIVMGSTIPLKLRVLYTDDLKQKTSLFSVQGKSAWYCFKAVGLLSYISSVSGTKSKCPNSHHSHPRHPFIAWIYREYKAQNRLIL